VGSMPRHPRPRPPAPEPAEFEAEVLRGLEPFAGSELRRLGASVGPDSRRFRYAGPWRRLLELRTVVAVHAVVARGLARPSALLDDGTFKRLTSAIGHIRSLLPAGAFGTFRLSAAGAESPAFLRVRERIARETGLRDVGEGGDLLLGFRRMPSAFELAVRISPRPLSARDWRVCNLPGALNAAVAAAMVQLAEPSADETFLNLACGSGTLLIERALIGPAGRLVGCDLDAGALACAAENVRAAGVGVELQAWDARELPLVDGTVDALVADLPFGQLMGSHEANAELYPRILAEATRVARPGGRFVAITQQVNLFERCLERGADRWSCEHTLRLELPTNTGPLKPRIYVLRRSDMT
jgi:tRNA (guanine6-N2)-methyltransferase